MRGRFVDLQDQHFGRLTVIAFVGYLPVGNKGARASYWTCRCECGSVYDYTMGNLRLRVSKQCRECGKKVAARKTKTHGMSYTPIYIMWHGCKCLCPEWQTFEVFYAAVGDRPDGKSLCRPDPEKPFGPDNFAWVSPEERKTMRLDAKINEYVALTGDDRQPTRDRFHRITRERRRQLVLAAKGECRQCHGVIVWQGEGKACLCKLSRGRRRRHWLKRIWLRLREDEGMSDKEVNWAASKVGRCKRIIPPDFRERCLTAGGVPALATHYGVVSATIRKWIRQLNLTRKIIYVDLEGDHG